MKYVAIVELEFQSARDALDELREALSRLEFLDHYHIIEQPRKLEALEAWTASDELTLCVCCGFVVSGGGPSVRRCECPPEQMPPVGRTPPVHDGKRKR